MKKLTSLILCGALCAGILVGCGKTDGNTTASSSTAAATEATTEATTEAVAPSYESAQALLESIHKAMPDDAEFPARPCAEHRFSFRQIPESPLPCRFGHRPSR